MKRSFQIALVLIYLAAILCSLVVYFKPGAAFFYRKIQIPNRALQRDGNAFDYTVDFDIRFYNPDTIMVWEDGSVFASTFVNDLQSGKDGIFALKEITSRRITVSFVPSDLSDPGSNEHIYKILIRPYLVDRKLASISLVILLITGMVFIASILVQPEKRLAWFAFLRGKWLTFWTADAKAARSVAISRIPSNIVALFAKPEVNNTILLAFLYVFMEWVFLVTKTSFMGYMDFWGKFQILMIAGLILVVVSLLAFPIIFLLDMVFRRVFPIFSKYMYHIPAAFLATCLSIILIDNFTYTIFKFGIVNLVVPWRQLYALAACIIFAFFLRWFSRSFLPSRRRVMAASLLMLFSVLLTIVAYNPLDKHMAQAAQNTTLTSKPNIILLSTDGLNATKMSVYGYERDTTPFIRQLAGSSLLAENNFTNASISAGSEISILTGKLPLSMHYLYPPDTLKGEDMYEHLPGLLRSYGYQTVSLGVEYYVDANYVNLKGGFDEVNGRDNGADDLSGQLSILGYGDDIYFISYIANRISDRLGHIFFFKDMANVHEGVTQPMTYNATDEDRLSALRTYLEDARQAGQPLFAHVHLMGTHGSYFDPPLRVFSANETQDQPWMEDFYDDAILTFDTQVESLVEYLRDQGLYDNTILVLYTDHGQKSTGMRRLPLIIHFPGNEKAGAIYENTQNLDIAPTLLDYLGVRAPDWMGGDSLLHNLDPNRLIVTAVVSNVEYNEGTGNWQLTEKAYQPPFYQFNSLIVIQCQRIYYLDLHDKTMIQDEVGKYQRPCPTETLDSPDVIHEKLGRLLQKLGYQLPADW